MPPQLQRAVALRSGSQAGLALACVRGANASTRPLVASRSAGFGASSRQAPRAAPSLQRSSARDAQALQLRDQLLAAALADSKASRQQAKAAEQEAAASRQQAKAAEAAAAASRRQAEVAEAAAAASRRQAKAAQQEASGARQQATATARQLHDTRLELERVTSEVPPQILNVSSVDYYLCCWLINMFNCIIIAHFGGASYAWVWPTFVSASLVLAYVAHLDSKSYAYILLTLVFASVIVVSTTAY